MSTPLAEEQAPASANDEFNTERVMTIAGGHFVHDTYSAFIAPLLPLLQGKLEISYALAGGLSVFTQIPSLLNPFIGYVADKVSVRYFIILAPGFTATIMSFMGLIPSYASLALLLFIAGISIAAFHAPAPAMISRVSGKRVGTGMSIFMASGELGRTVGPIFVAAGVAWFGLEGIWRLSILGWIASAILYVRLRHIPASGRPKLDTTLARELLPKAGRFFGVLAWLMVARQFMIVALTTFLPIFMTDVYDADLWLSAQSLTILEGAGVVGALFSGTLSDRIGRKRMLSILLFIAPFLMLLFLYAGSRATVILALILLGFTAISVTPVLLATVQDQFPNNGALANGTFMALNFLIRASAIWIVGLLADQIGLFTVFLGGAIFAWLSVPAVWFLPERPAV
ncbi:MAG: MFS transporter [Chloroflexota bacterium]